ncbi:ABC transporter ATP-binding protein [Halorientalis brevis]|uniref:Molybdate/tungstate import ATP-binding protein WtpC n=1 Tax=Halorientalis brevis TaxID=1126241 RepID=A0ABD6CD61_9EURY|nr:ABC transporter ATP-binding protein [Halorientalis brevis]
MTETRQLDPETSGESILEITDLTKVYPDGTVAVEEVSFDIKRGDFCVLIGPSGCGKSTTLHSIVGRFPITEGSIHLDGVDITDAPTYERDIGLVFQDFQLFPHLSVRENIAYGLDRLDTPAAERDERVSEMLDIMRLADLGDRSPEELSAGQKQRVALARSLVLEPKLLLLDEPLGDMDYKLQKRMERELLRIHRDIDTTFVYVTHDQTQAMRLGDQLIVMNDGKIEHSGPTEEVYNEPATAFVSTFVGDSNVFTGELVGTTNGGFEADIETPLGTFAASTDNLESDPASLVGTQIPFSVRPQYLELGAGEENVLTCTVDDVIHQPGSGTLVLLTAQVDGADPMELQLKSSEIVAVEDDEIEISWSPQHATLLERTSVLPDIDLAKDVLGE